MTTKMTRRTFLKGAAAAAAAVSLSGLLTGCGGDQELPDNAVQLGVFNATVGGSKLTQVAPTGNLVVSDALLGKPFATKEKDLKLSFPDVATREAYQSGKPAYLTITINGMTGVLYLVKRGNGYVATKTVG